MEKEGKETQIYREKANLFLGQAMKVQVLIKKFHPDNAVTQTPGQNHSAILTAPV